MSDFESRLRNYGLWVSIFAFVPMVLQAFGIKMFSSYNDIVNSFLGILVLLGLINNPTTLAKWYLDDKKKKDESQTDDQSVECHK